MGNTNIKVKVRLGNPIECGKGVLIPLILNDRNVKMIKVVKNDDGTFSEAELLNDYELQGAYKTSEGNKTSNSDNKVIDSIELENIKKYLLTQGFIFNEYGDIINYDESIKNIVSCIESFSGETKEHMIQNIKNLEDIVSYYNNGLNEYRNDIKTALQMNDIIIGSTYKELNKHMENRRLLLRKLPQYNNFNDYARCRYYNNFYEHNHDCCMYCCNIKCPQKVFSKREINHSHTIQGRF